MTKEEAIEMLKKDKEQRGKCFISDALDMAIKALEQEPKTGQWIHIINDKWKCSRCENIILTEGSWEKPEDKYCKVCGAKMVEPTCDTCEYNTAAFMPCNACENKSEYKPQESEE